jgi:hypothetical protein
VPSFESVEATGEPEKTLFGKTPRGRTLGKGSICRVEKQDEVATRLRVALSALGLAVYDLEKDGVYGTQIAPNRFLFLNPGKEAAEARVSLAGEKSWHTKCSSRRNRAPGLRVDLCLASQSSAAQLFP